MIKNHDRSKWFGASDTHFIMGNWQTKTFAKWWCVKLGLLSNEFSTKETKAGNAYEHKIARAIEQVKNTKIKLDRQIKFRNLRVRVNLDCEDKNTIFEIKTFKYKKDWEPCDSYIMQTRVQMYFTKKQAFIVAYPMLEENYINYFLPIDMDKLQFFKIKQDTKFINEYLQKVKYLKKCLIRGTYPNEQDRTKSKV